FQSPPKHDRKRPTMMASRSLQPSLVRASLACSSAKLSPAVFRTLAAFPQSSSCGDARDDAFVISGPDNCGTTEYELVAAVGALRTITDEGPATAFGACTGNYTDCQRVFHSPSAQQGHEALFDTAPAPPGQVGFYWVLDDWVNSTSGCSCSDPNPNGSTIVTI